MCGIAGIMLKQGNMKISTGQALVDMLDGCQHRGPDSTRFRALRRGRGRSPQAALLRRRGQRGGRLDRPHPRDARHARRRDRRGTANRQRLPRRGRGDRRPPEVLLRHRNTPPRSSRSARASRLSKDIGSAHDVDGTFNVHDFDGTHGLGHVRLATESDVRPEASHPFWATGFSDVAIVHNGQITNYWKMRRRLERRGFQFTTDNDFRADRGLPRRQDGAGRGAQGRARNLDR